MLEKIKALTFVEWTAILAAVALLLLLPGAFGGASEGGPDPSIYPSFFSPWAAADAVTTEIAIREFNGESSGGPFWEGRAVALGAVLLYYVTGPGLLILCGIGASSGKRGPTEGTPAKETSAKETPAEETLEKKASGRSWRDRFFQAGLGLALAGLVNLGLLSVLPRLAYRQARASNANQMAEDQLVREVHAVARAAYQYYALPDSLGGGEGSFEGITPSSVGFGSNAPDSSALGNVSLGDVSLSDVSLSDGSPDAFSSTTKNRSARHRLRVKSDTLLKIISAGLVPRPQAESSHAEKSDSIHVVTEVTPRSVVDIEVRGR